jgi:hypothetical protein
VVLGRAESIPRAAAARPRAAAARPRAADASRINGAPVRLMAPPPPPPARGAHRAQLPLLLRTVAATLLLCLDGRAGAQTTCYYSTYYSVYPVSAGDILYADWSDGTIIGVGAECGGATYCEASYGSHACEGWRIRCNSDEVAHVQFSDGKFNTESGYDWVQLYDGDQTTPYGDPTMPYHSRFAGSSDPSPIHLTGSSRTMTVVWDTDGSVTRTGWQAKAFCVDKTRCAAGEYRYGSSSPPTCIACASGQYREDRRHAYSYCTDCPAGKRSQTDRTACEDCPTGQTSSAGGSTCFNCPAGQYLEVNMGAYQCMECPADTFMESSGHVETLCTACSAGEFSPAGSTSSSACAKEQASATALGILLLAVAAAIAVGVVCCCRNPKCCGGGATSESASGVTIVQQQQQPGVMIVQQQQQQQQQQQMLQHGFSQPQLHHAYPVVPGEPVMATAVSAPVVGVPVEEPWQQNVLNAPPGAVPSPAPAPAPVAAPEPAPAMLQPSAPPAFDLNNATMKELREKAAAMGVNPERIEDARDQHDPRAALISLILNAQAPPVAAGGLGDLTVRELRERAAAVGVDAQAIEEARDAHDPRAAMIALIESSRGNATGTYQGP